MTGLPHRSDHAPWGTHWVLPIIACILYLLGSASYLGQWDSFDYLKQVVTHQLSDLGVGRPVFIGYNILLWELMRRVFGLAPLGVGPVVMAGIVAAGVLGVVLFRRFVRQLFTTPASQMATLGLLLSPMYALYSGCVMTEVPMLVATIAAASAVWFPNPRRHNPSDLAAGFLFGVAVGIREQALTLLPALLWILWVRRPDLRTRLRSLAYFGVPAFLVIVSPVLVLYIHNPKRFVERMNTWFGSVPMGQAHFWTNVEASLLYVLLVCPGAWLGAVGAGIGYGFRRVAAGVGRNGGKALASESGGISLKEANPPIIPSPWWGILFCLVLPVASFWRNADVQMHPRYLMIVLPAVLVLCVSLFSRWAPSAKAALAWSVLQVVVCGAGLAVLAPYHRNQVEKMDYARLVRDSVPGEGLLIAGRYSPMLDYYRGLGDRPQWRILWSGWGWNGKAAETLIRDAWSRQEPVYLCEGPLAWFYLEDERLDLLYILARCKKEEVAHGLFCIYPESVGSKQ